MKEPKYIERIKPPSRQEFYDKYVSGSRPVVLTGLTDSWPAIKKWNFEYFAQNFGNVQAGSMQLNGMVCDVDTYAETEKGRASVNEIIKGNRVEGGKVVASPIENFPETLSGDYTVPEYCADGKFRRSRIYMGPKGVITPLHHDLPENLYVMIAGEKRITLFDARESDKLYRNSVLSKHPNFSKVDLNNPNYELYPAFKLAQPYVVDLKAGETLFIPSLWWHHLQNTEPSIAMNFWWSTGWKVGIAWGAATYKKLRG